jgi:hypothetical protein
MQQILLRVLELRFYPSLKRNAHRVLVRNPEIKRSLGRPRRRWEVNIHVDFLKE